MKIVAPISGQLIPLSQVPDPVFAQKMVGDGIAIDPTENVLRSPIAGEVIQLHPSHHAISVSAQGVTILMHIGIDTVALKGKGFSPKVMVGDNVACGDTLIEFDADFIAQNAKSLITIVLSTGDNALFNFASGTALAKQTVIFDVASNGNAKTTARNGTGSSAKGPQVKINLPTGFHARPAAIMVSMAKNYKSDIEIVKKNDRANAKSVVSLLGLQMEYGDMVHFEAKGADAEAAVSELTELVQDLREAAGEHQASPKTQKRESTDPNILTGVAISPGLAIGRVFQLKAETFDIIEKSSQPANKEKVSLSKAIDTATGELEKLMEQVKAKANAGRAAIFAAHIEILHDPDILQAANRLIDQGKSAAFAWQKTVEEHASRLSKLNNELLANRANDLRDVGRRVLKQLAPPKESKAASALPDNSILIAENLTPSETVQIDRHKVVAFCTTTGGATSHVAILARSLGLPALAGADPRVLSLAYGSEIILDGDNGEIRLNPSDEQKKEVSRAQSEEHERREAALSLAHQPANTRDGHRIEVAANIGSVEDARQAVELGADGVGLLRSEFLFLERDTAPSEEEQYQVYQDIADALGPKPLVIRTLDVGGDKPLRYLPMPAEENPFLGVRGIRIGLVKPEILRTQLRAILRVKSEAKLHVMFPMIATVQEFREAKMMLEEEREKLQASPVAVGVMIEVPSAALIADVLAQEVDFFSIGTNDLTQYTLAMDRGHKDLAKQVDALHPAVLKLIEMTAQAGNRHGKWVGVCGGLASDLNAVAILLGLGITELSVSLPTIPLVKSRVRESTLTDAQGLAERALLLKSGAEVRELEKQVRESSTPEGMKHVDR
jgi:phosphocarrier protein FPr